jgi:cysteine-rich repeat protein
VSGAANTNEERDLPTMKRSARAALLLVLVTAATTTPASGDASYRIDSGISQTDVAVEPITTAESGADFYNFVYNAEDNAVATPPFELFDHVAHVYLHEDSRYGQVSLGVILEKPNQSSSQPAPPTGGAAQITVRGLPAGTTILLLDDENTDSGVIDPSGTADFVFEWGACCTDGFVLGNLPPQGWVVTVSWGSSQDITFWQFLSGDPVNPVRHHLGPLSNTLVIRGDAASTCGDGQITGSETCDDGNTTPGDHCDASCRVEQFVCSGPQPVPCNDDDACPASETCQSGRCDADPSNAGCDGLGARCGDDADCGSGGSCCGPVCGNGFVEIGERCDLGSGNGAAGSSCTGDCQLTGICTVSRTSCATAADCPSAEGCCQNGSRERDEQCDDGNAIDGDCCSRTCQAEPAAECVPMPAVCSATYGPHLIDNPTFQQTKMQDRDRPMNTTLDKWTAKGDFVLRDGQRIDPDTEIVELVLSQLSTPLYDPLLSPDACPGELCFLPRTNRVTHVDSSWQFALRGSAPDVAGAPGLRKAKLSRVPSQPNKVRFTLAGADGSDILRPAPLPGVSTQGGVRRVRQTLRIGDDCITRTLDCDLNSSATTFTCVAAHCGNRTIDRGEQCGEIGLPACGAGYACDTCRCVRE